MARRAGTAQSNGASVRYEVAGDGETLVLIHAGIRRRQDVRDAERSVRGALPCFYPLRHEGLRD